MFLTEEKLSNVLPDIVGSDQFVRNKTVPDSDIPMRPDFRFDDLKLIVEFDGWQHYCLSKTQAFDMIKKDVYCAMGYTIINIPYFIQLSTETISVLFPESEYTYEQEYPHGFVDKRCAVPGDFNPMGIDKFKNDMAKFSENVNYQVEMSLIDRIITLEKRYSKKYSKYAVLGNI